MVGGGGGGGGAKCRRNEKMTSVYRKKDGSVRGFSMGPESACSVSRTNNGNPADAVLGRWRLSIGPGGIIRRG